MASKQEAAEMGARYRAGGYGYGHAKSALLKLIKERFSEPRQRFAALMACPGEVEDILLTGAQRSRAIAQRVLHRARTASGI